MYNILKENVTIESTILDLGTGGGEKVLKYFPNVKEILGTDYSEEMIKTANENLIKSGRNNITFKVMNSLKMEVKDNYFDVIVARHTVTDPKQIYKALKPNGMLIIRGVDKMDCYELKKIYGQGLGLNNNKPISQIDYDNVIDAGFKEVELIPLHVREYYKTREDLYALLLKTPILGQFNEIDSNKLDDSKIDEYIKRNTYQKGIRLVRRYYGIVGRK